MAPLRRIRPDEITARAPLPFAVFDKEGRELYAAGVVIGSIGYTQLLLGRGLYCSEPIEARGSVSIGTAPQGHD